MSKFDETSPRRVVPRWRVAHDSAAAAERVPVPLSGEIALLNPVQTLSEVSQAWKEAPSLGTALDLLSTAHFLRAFDIAQDAARFVLEQSDAVPKVALSLARAVQQRVHGIALFKGDVRSQKQRLRSQPNNPLLLVDLARHYSSIGQNERAKRYMLMALRYAPNHRFVLRAASRFFVHTDEVERAHGLLVSRAVTRTDPWLLAAEISIAAIAEKRSRLLKQGEAIMAGGAFSADQLTELASALGTVELGHGKARAAKKLFTASLKQPNDNSLAQAEWAMRLHKLDLPVVDLAHKVPKRFEADFWLSYRAKDLKEAKTYAEAWRDDEPFSARPAVMGQFAASLDEDYGLAKKISHAALIANPNHPQLIQNLIFAEAMTGNLLEAWSLLSHHVERGSVQSLANLGLIAYRAGHIDLGRRCYETAIVRATSLKDPHFRAMAEANFAREAFLAKDPKSDAIIRRATAFLKTTQDLVGAQLVWERTVGYLTGKLNAPTPNGKLELLPTSSIYLKTLELKQ